MCQSDPLNWYPLPFWRELPAQVRHLPAREIHVWRIDLRAWQSQAAEFFTLLAADEQERAARLYFERDRTAFILCRGMLRHLLGQYLDITPADLCFSYSAYGKPALKEWGAGELFFNLSHSQQWALVAIAAVPDIGIDIECLRPVDATALARRFFTEREFEWVRSLPEIKQQQAFFQLWTTKEAYLKATGEGISRLQRVEIDPAGWAASDSSCIRLQDLDQPNARPLLWRLPALLGYEAHLAVQGDESDGGRGVDLSVGSTDHSVQVRCLIPDFDCAQST